MTFSSPRWGCLVTPLPLPESVGVGGGHVYAHSITNFFFSFMGLPNFLTHGAPLARFVHRSSAKIHEVQWISIFSNLLNYKWFIIIYISPISGFLSQLNTAVPPPHFSNNNILIMTSWSWTCPCFPWRFEKSDTTVTLSNLDFFFYLQRLGDTVGRIALTSLSISNLNKSSCALDTILHPVILPKNKGRTTVNFLI